MNQASDISNMMRSICSSLEIPVIAVLLCILVFTLVLAGSLIAEIFTTRRHLKVWVPRLIDDIKRQEVPPALCIKRSGLLKNQKLVLIEVTEHKDITNAMRESMAIRLIDETKARYDIVVKLSDLVIRIGPVFGLLGTLIPLGPGIIALGQGDTYTLSQSLLTAFDTTILGLISAAICTVISMVRKRWYTNDMSILETLMECVLEVTNKTEPAMTEQPRKASVPLEEIREEQPVSEPVKPEQAFLSPEDTKSDQPLQAFLPPEDVQSDQPMRVYLPTEDAQSDQPMRVYLSEDQTVARPLPKQSVPESPAAQQERQTKTLPRKLPPGFAFMPESEQQRILKEME